MDMLCFLSWHVTGVIIINIHQFQLTYLAEEDRIHLYLSSEQQEEIILVLTRRYLKGLWPLLLKLLEIETTPSPINSEVQKAATVFQHEKVMESVDYSQHYQTKALSHPLGKKPVILTEAKIIKNKNEQWLLSLIPPSHQGITIPKDHQLLHCLYHHLPKLIEIAQWDLTLPMIEASSMGLSKDRLN